MLRDEANAEAGDGCLDHGSDGVEDELSAHALPQGLAPLFEFQRVKTPLGGE
jgi:hypothetical protein